MILSTAFSSRVTIAHETHHFRLRHIFASSDSERDPGYTAGCRGRHVAE